MPRCYYIKDLYRDDHEVDSRTELDTHADTCVAGDSYLMIRDEGMRAQVHPYSTEYKPLEAIIGTAATLWDDPTDGQPYILIVNQALFFGSKVKTSLLNPNQLRANGLRVDDIPRQFEKTSTHAIHFPDSDVVIPMSLRGVMSGFESRKPTMQEVDQYPHLELTADTVWVPSSAEFSERERAIAATVNSVRRGTDVSEGSNTYCHNLERQVSAARSWSRLTAMSLEDSLCFSQEKDLEERAIASIRVHYGASDDQTTHGDQGPQVAAISISEQRSVITPEALAKRWFIGIDTAKNTLRATTQAGVRNVLAPGERKLRQRTDHLKFPSLRGRFYTDTMFAKVKAIHGHKAAQVFTNGRGFDYFYPMKLKSEAPDALLSFIQNVGIPQTIVSDNAPEEVRGRWSETVRYHRMEAKQTVPHSPWQNLAEASIREIKVGIRRAMQRTRSPMRLWNYCGNWVTAVRRMTALNMPQLDGRVPMEDVLGTTPDISAYAQFDWYELVRYYTPTPGFPYERKCVGRWLGVAEACVDSLAFNILSDTGKILVRKSVWAISNEDRLDPIVQADILEFDAKIQSKIGDSIKDSAVDPEIGSQLPAKAELIFEDEEIDEPVDVMDTKLERDDYTPEAYDQYLTAKVLLPHGGELKQATVRGRKHDADGVPVGKRHPNPILDTRQYEVEFPDGSTEALAANLIAENIYAQVDEEGRTYSILGEILDHRTNGHALSKDDGYTVDKHGKRHPKTTTRGWELQVEWKDGSTSWVPLKDLKESNPVELAEYAISNKIAEEPAFAWWVHQTLRRRSRIIAKVKTRYWRRTHKYGIELPHSVKEALAIDERTGTDLWRIAIEKEMKNVMTAFEFREDDKMPVGYKRIECHMIFDVKIDLTRKARLVAGGHQTDPPKDSTYSSVVSRDSVRIAFLLAALNDLDILAADVQNAYLNAETKEKVYTVAGMEFGANKVGRPVLIVRALYGLKSSGARWRDHMATTLRKAGFIGSMADPDVWMRAQTKPCGTRYWEYVLCYVDDILAVSHDPQAIMDYLSQNYTLKSDSVKTPDTYLGAEVRKHTLASSDNPTKTRWALSPDTYVKRAISEVERELANVGQRLVSKVTTPISVGYRPELDVSQELDANRASYYQGLIGVLRWMCELGRVDIMTAVAMMSRFMAAPRKGHLEQVLHMFAYLKKYDRSAMVFDDTEPVFEESRFAKCDWEEFYPGACEVTPPNAPEVLGKAVVMSCFADADHAGCRATRRSHTGVLIFVNRAPILWYSKRQNTVETSTFGSEFIAMKTATEMVEGLRYKLRMMGVEVAGPTNVFCDNESVVMNATRPESTLKKKHNAIAYHRVREAQAAQIIRVAKEDGLSNLADILTKIVPGPRLRELCGYILH